MRTATPHCSSASIRCFRWLLRSAATRAAVTCSRRYSDLWRRGEDPRANASGDDCSPPKSAHQPGKQNLFDRRCEWDRASCLPSAAQPTLGRLPNIQTRRQQRARSRACGRRFDSLSGQGVNGILSTGIVGTLLTLVVLIFGSLWPAIALHALVDIGSGLVAWLALRQVQGEGVTVEA